MPPLLMDAALCRSCEYISNKYANESLRFEVWSFKFGVWRKAAAISSLFGLSTSLLEMPQGPVLYNPQKNPQENARRVAAIKPLVSAHCGQ
jgi:hypothetical protein